MVHPRRLVRSLIILIGATVAVFAFAGQAMAAEASPGDATITVPVGDDIAGGSHDITFEKVYADTTPAGTPVYVYAPVGWNVNGGKGVLGLDPQVDPNPLDTLKPCADRDAAEYVITQGQIDQLGNALRDQIVKVDEAQFGPIGLADASDPDSDSLVVLAYNAFDDYFYFCDETSYTAGYFAPNFIADLGMNIIVVDVLDWANSIGAAGGYSIEGIIAHELEHLVMEYSDPTELSWVDEGLADVGAFFNNYYGDENSALAAHSAYHQVYHRETSLTRWGGGLENYGAAYSWFVYLWEQAGGNGGTGPAALKPDGDYDNAGGDLLIKLIFQNEADSWEGIEAAILQWEAQTGKLLPDVQTLFQDWVVATYFDQTGTRFGFTNLEFGTEGTSWGYTVDLANNFIWGGRGIYKGAMPEPKWRKGNVPAQVALPYGTSFEEFTNAGSSVAIDFTGQPGVDIVPPTGTAHWWAGYQNNSERELNVTSPTGALGGKTLTFDTWFFIENGWDYGFVEAKVGGVWTTVPVSSSGQVISTNTNPQGNNTEGNGLTGVSGGSYDDGDQPAYIPASAVLPTGTTDVRFRYSTDAGYLDTGWFVSNVKVDGAQATLGAPESEWSLIDGPEQDNNWSVQLIAGCDLTPGVTSEGETVDGQLYVYRFVTDSKLAKSGFDLRCTKGGGKTRPVVVAISNLPTGQLTFFDSPYSFRLSNTGSGSKAK
jgi:hypothetical protein